MRFSALILAAMTAVGCSGVAFANAPEVYDKCESNVNGIGTTLYARSCAWTSAQSGNDVTFAGIGNGYNSISNVAQAGGVYSTSSSDGGWTNFSSGVGGAVSSSGSSSLLDGTLHAYVDAGSGQGFSNVRISDIVTFNNLSGSSVYLTVGYTFDGEFIGAGGNNFDYATISLALGSPVTRNITFANSGLEVGGTGISTLWADGYFNQGWYNSGTAADFVITGNGTPGSGPFSGGISTTLVIPTGVSNLGFAFTLDLSCRVIHSVCNFGNTGSFNFGNLPTGLSYTSESGVLFSGLKGTGAVPEPTSWALMIVGFGIAGALMRRRSEKLAVA